MVAELHRHDMGQLLDIVPNHMCIESAENHWWRDVLENGRTSPYAAYFDIDWSPVKKELLNKVLLPILGDQYGKVLEEQELTARSSSRRRVLCLLLRAPVPARSQELRVHPEIPPARTADPSCGRQRSHGGAAEHRDRAEAPAFVSRNGYCDRRGAEPRKRGDQAAAEHALPRLRRVPGPSGHEPAAVQRDKRRPQELRPHGRAHEPADLPAFALAGGHGGDQLSPLLRCERARRDPHGERGGLSDARTP